MAISAPSHPYLGSGTPIAVAHRGGALEAPENTIEAFRASADLGYRYLETDAQLSADGVVVAFHDDRIDRVSSSVGAIDEWHWEDLQKVSIGGTGRLSSIADLLSEFPDHNFNLDAKSDAVVEPLLAVIAEADAFDRVCLGSFSDDRLERMRQIGPENVCTSFGPKAIAAQILRGIGLRARKADGRAAQVPPTYNRLPIITKRFVDKAHADGLAVHAWTIDDEEEMHHLLDLGVDGIMTDRPTVLKRVFATRGLAL